MNLDIIAVGKLKEKYFEMAIDEYKKRLSAYSSMNIYEVQDEPVPNQISEEEAAIILKKEEERIINKIKDFSYLIALDIQGQQMSSEGLAKFLENKMIYGTSRFTFLIGGTLGLSNSIISRCDSKLSFSKFTFPHQLMRVILCEQLYRCFTIINGTPYHR